MSVVEPYYQDEWTTIYHGDCREILAEVGPVGCIVTDPPYGQTSLAWDRWCHGWVDAVAANVEPAVPLWCFGSLRMFMDHADDFAAWSLAQDIVWEKHNGSSFHADRFRRVHEQAVQWYRGEWGDVWREVQTTPDATARTVRRTERPTHMGEIADSTYTSVDGGPRLMRSVLQVRSEHGRADHPTQKPLGIVSPLVAYSCPPASVVLDPFMGSGTTLVAAKRMNRHSIGIEIEERYCEVAAKRLAQGVLDLGA